MAPTTYLRRVSAPLAALASIMLLCSAHGATKERVYTMGDNDPGAVVGGKPPLNPNSGYYETVDIQPSTTDFRGTDPPNQTNVSLVPLNVFVHPVLDFAPRYVLAADRPGAAAGNLALQFDGVQDPIAGDNMFSDTFDPRDFGGFFTLAQAWVKPTSTDFSVEQFIFRIGRENGAVKISTTGFWTLQTGNTATPPDEFQVISSVAVVPDQWTHVAVGRGGNDSTLYINGSLAARDNGFWGGEGPEVTLGANTQALDSFFKGVIDNFNIASQQGGFDSGRDIDYFADKGITFSGVAGDINQDGAVNNSDYLIWSQNVGFSAAIGGDASTLLKGDADRSGRIDLFDFRIIQQVALAAGTPLTGIPEPGSLALASSALAAWGMCRARMKRRPGSQCSKGVALSVVTAAVMLAGGWFAAPARAEVVVAEDFLYDGPSKVLHVGGGFTGNTRYGGGQNGPLGSWETLWGQVGDGIITTPTYVPPNPPGDAEPGTPFNVALYDGFFGVQSELFRDFDLAPAVPANQTLYFGGRFKVDLDIGADGRTVPQFYAPRLFLNRIAGDDRMFDINGILLPNQRNRTQDIGVGIHENMVVARLGGGPETSTVAATNPPDDGNWHLVVGKLELNVAGGTNERLSVWLDPTGVETGGTMAQVQADVLTDLTGLIGRMHAQGSVPIDPPDPEVGRSYMDDVVIGTAWQDVATVNVPRLTLRINPTSGAGQLINTTNTPFPLDAYSIESSAGALNGTGWNSLDEQNLGNWHQDLATANQIVESNFLATTTIAPGGQLPLGNLFNVGGSQSSVTGRYSTGDGLINVLKVEFSTAGLMGDYDQNSRVDGRDFLVWQRTLGMPAAPAGSGADGNNNGTIDAGDLTVWRNNFGQSLANAAASAVPEPTTAAVLWGAAPALIVLRLRGASLLNRV